MPDRAAPTDPSPARAEPIPRAQPGEPDPSTGSEAPAPADPAVTIYEVAARAGVSISTVSHALNRPDRVAEDTRRRVLESADQLGFTPRGRGRAHSAGRSLAIAVVAPFSLHPSYLRRLTGIMPAARERHLDVVVAEAVSADGALAIDRLGVGTRIGGAVIMGAEPTDHLAQVLTSRRIATVVVDCPTDRWTSVVVDDEAGGRLIAGYLMRAGAQRPMWVSPLPPESRYVTSGERRLRGLTEGLRAAGFRGSPAWLPAPDTYEGGRAAALALDATDLPDAVIAIHDAPALGFLAGLRERGLRVPEDVAVVGYDDGDAAALAGLTTVRQPFEATGTAAVEALDRLLTGPDGPVSRTCLVPELVVRASTRPPTEPAPPPGRTGAPPRTGGPGTGAPGTGTATASEEAAHA